MYKINKLTKSAWMVKRAALQKQYRELSNMVPKRFVKYLKQVCDSNTIYCNSCRKSLHEYIGKKIVMNRGIKHKPWYCIPCSIKLHLLTDEDIKNFYIK